MAWNHPLQKWRYRGNGRPTTYAHDGASRLTALSHDLAGDAYDLSSTFAYSPASQIVEAVRGNDAYAFTNLEVADYHSPANGLNQLANVNGLPFVYDARGNLTRLGDLGWGYSADNRLRVATSSGAPGVNMAYDPTGRLIHIDSSLTDFRYDGDQLLEESQAGTSTLRRRFVHGPGVDEPIASYDTWGVRSWYHADERGSIVVHPGAASVAIIQPPGRQRHFDLLIPLRQDRLPFVREARIASLARVEAGGGETNGAGRQPHVGGEREQEALFGLRR